MNSDGPSDGLSRQHNPLDLCSSGLLEGPACVPRLCLHLGGAKPPRLGEKRVTTRFSVGSSAGPWRARSGRGAGRAAPGPLGAGRVNAGRGAGGAAGERGAAAAARRSGGCR